MGVDGAPGSGDNMVMQLLRQQADQVRRRDQVRLAASAAIIPAALVGATMISTYGAPGKPGAFVSWLLLMLACLLMADGGRPGKSAGGYRRGRAPGGRRGKARSPPPWWPPSPLGS